MEMLAINHEDVGLFCFHDIVDFVDVDELLVYLEFNDEFLEILVNLLFVNVGSEVNSLIICNSY
jgi:hypothetical protein